jgi:hypothetical protein
MRIEVTGTVVAGGLRLDAPIDLPDNSRVRVAVEPLQEWRARFQAGLAAWERLRQQYPINSGGLRYTRDDLHEHRSPDHRTEMNR